MIELRINGNSYQSETIIKLQKAINYVKQLRPIEINLEWYNSVRPGLLLVQQPLTTTHEIALSSSDYQ